MSDTEVVVFLGDRIDDPGEVRFINRLRRDLEGHNVPASLFANFIAAGRQQRQIDLLLLTPDRLVHCELKVFNQHHPLIGGPNGRWKFMLPDGSERELDGNPYRQAQDGTFAISDVMRALARQGNVPRVDRFYRYIDTVACIYPAIPRGSQLGSYAYVQAISYDELLARVTSEGPRLPWGSEDWREFARHLGTFREHSESDGHRARLSNEHTVADYRRRFRRNQAQDLHELVPVALASNGRDVKQTDVAHELTIGQAVVLLGQSGLGKTHTARHTAIELTDQGHVVVWVRCAEYEQGRFDLLLARAVAPFTTDHATELISKAMEMGAEVILVLDGWNECPEQARNDLVLQISAFRLRYPVGALITTQTPVSMPETLSSTEICLRSPDEGERRAILASYGVTDQSGISDEFATPYELSVVALCAADLDRDSTTSQLIDAYIRRFASTETIRAALRTVAAAMDAQLRSSLPVLEVMSLLERGSEVSFPPQLVDNVFGNTLLVSNQGRVSFQHELISRFLAAETVVRKASTGSELGQLLAQPHHRELCEYALSVEHDHQRQADALTELADPELYVQAALGKFGPRLQSEVVAEVSGLLSEAAFATANHDAHLLGEASPILGVSWRSERMWSQTEVALFSAAGMGIWHGLFVGEIVALLDRTDELCLANVSTLRAAGIPNPISLLVAGTYAQVTNSGSEGLAASIVTNACVSGRYSARSVENRVSVAPQVLVNATDSSWGRLHLAAVLFSPADRDDREHLAALVRKAWNAVAYHVRLEALWAAERSARSLEPDLREAVEDVLEKLSTDNIMLNTTLVDTLAAFDMIEQPIASLADIRAHIEEVLSREDSPDAQDEAAAIISRQFEREAIVGPYCEAIDELSDSERLRLLLMAASVPDSVWMHRDWVLEELADRATAPDQRVVQVIGEAASRIRTEGPMLQDEIAAHLAAIRGWARISDALPEASEVASTDDRAWRAIDEVILRLQRGEFAVPPQWRLLHGELAPAAVDVFYRLSWSAVMERGEVTVHEQITRAFPEELRRLLEWGLTNRNRLTSKFDFPDARERDQYIVRTLGRVGVASTASLLRDYLVDPEIGNLAVASVRELENRRE
jgi:hypothetical protein